MDILIQVQCPKFNVKEIIVRIRKFSESSEGDNMWISAISIKFLD